MRPRTYTAAMTTAAPATYERITVEPVTATIGAVVGGIDLTEPLPDDQRDEIHDALMRHLVLFFRDQPLSRQQHVDFAARFGELASGTPDDPDDPLGEYFVSLEDTADAEPKADRWHTDIPFAASPPDLAVLTMVAPAPVGGDTMWLNLYEVYERLSPTAQELLAQLDMEFDMGPSKEAARDLYGEEYYQELLANEPTAIHPLVRRHPVTGRAALYLGGAFMRRIVGLHPDESDALIGFLRSRLEDPNVQCRWRWRQHDVVMWDERCTNHRALSDHYPSYRHVRRCLVGQGTPVGVR